MVSTLENRRAQAVVAMTWTGCCQSPVYSRKAHIIQALPAVGGQNDVRRHLALPVSAATGVKEAI